MKLHGNYLRRNHDQRTGMDENRCLIVNRRDCKKEFSKIHCWREAESLSLSAMWAANSENSERKQSSIQNFFSCVPFWKCSAFYFYLCLYFRGLSFQCCVYLHYIAQCEVNCGLNWGFLKAFSREFLAASLGKATAAWLRCSEGGACWALPWAFLPE